MPVSVDWYFDFVSPYSYIALHRLEELPAPVAYKPVLFAGLLNHWGQKGPAEIPAKRRWTYRWCIWWAKSLGIPFRFPAAHPFNPLPHLRLALACGSRPEAVVIHHLPQRPRHRPAEGRDFDIEIGRASCRERV